MVNVRLNVENPNVKHEHVVSEEKDELSVIEETINVIIVVKISIQVKKILTIKVNLIVTVFNEITETISLLLPTC